MDDIEAHIRERENSSINLFSNMKKKIRIIGFQTGIIVIILAGARNFKSSDQYDKFMKMNDKLTVTGKIVSGEKKGAVFTQLDWVQNQCQEKLGFKPFPGTLNLEIESAKIPHIEALLKRSGLKLVPPDPNFCTAHVYPVNIMGVSGAIVAPAEDVRVHNKNILELIAPACLKEAMDVDDGDEIMLVAQYPNPPGAQN